MTTKRKYSGVAMALHWLIAALVLYNIFLPPEFEDIGHDIPPELAASMTALHIGIGLSIIVLMALRLFWRVGHHAPPLPDTMKSWEKRLAHFTHIGLYVVVFLMVALGFATALLAPYPASGFGVVPVAGFITVDQGVFDIVKELHHTGNKVLQAFVYVHIAAVLYHQFIKKDGQLWSMLPWGK